MIRSLTILIERDAEDSVPYEKSAHIVRPYKRYLMIRVCNTKCLKVFCHTFFQKSGPPEAKVCPHVSYFFKAEEKE